MTGFDEAMTHRNTKSAFFGKLFCDVNVVQPPTAQNSQVLDSTPKFAENVLRPDSKGNPFTLAGLKRTPSPSLSKPSAQYTPSAGDLPEAALLQVRLLPIDEKKEVPVAVHIVKNITVEENDPPQVPGSQNKSNRKKPPQMAETFKQMMDENRRINENPYYHSVVASSEGATGKEYQAACEVGCVCKLYHGDTKEDEGQPVIVIPSLESKMLEGKFTLQILATEDIIVERVN